MLLVGKTTGGVDRRLAAVCHLVEGLGALGRFFVGFSAQGVTGGLVAVGHRLGQLGGSDVLLELSTRGTGGGLAAVGHLVERLCQLGGLLVGLTMRVIVDGLTAVGRRLGRIRGFGRLGLVVGLATGHGGIVSSLAAVRHGVESLAALGKVGHFWKVRLCWGGFRYFLCGCWRMMLRGGRSKAEKRGGTGFYVERRLGTEQHGRVNSQATQKTLKVGT